MTRRPLCAAQQWTRNRNNDQVNRDFSYKLIYYHFSTAPIHQQQQEKFWRNRNKMETVPSHRLIQCLLAVIRKRVSTHCQGAWIAYWFCMREWLMIVLMNGTNTFSPLLSKILYNAKRVEKFSTRLTSSIIIMSKHGDRRSRKIKINVMRRKKQNDEGNIRRGFIQQYGMLAVLVIL